MKNVLFATTALVAFAGAAAAEVSFGGSLTAGYNDEVEGGLFWEADLSVTGTVDMGDGLVATATATLVEWDGTSTSETDDFTVTVEIAYDAGAYQASLKYGDLGDEGASEYYYADRSGMAIDVANHDGDEDVRAMIEFGSFGVAVGCGDVANGECNDGMNVGAGGTFGDISVGVGYDTEDGGQDATMAASVDATFGAAEIGVSYANNTTDDESSIGIEGSYAINEMMSVGAYYAINSDDDNAYGANADYTSGAFSIGVFFDGVEGGDAEYGADGSFAVNDMLTVSAGLFQVDDGSDMVYYVGMDYAVNDSVTATVSYATADEIGGPEYKDGITALITGSF